MPPRSSFPIVGIGASAGGIEALEGLFLGMPDDPGVAIVVVTHLNPDRDSVLDEIVARYTRLPVEVAADGVELGPNRVYITPSDAVLGISNGRLQLHKLDPMRRERKPIDVFLSALAKDQSECAVSIILSGLDGDGTLGTKAVKERGGLTLAQIADGYGPKYPDMPNAAIATGLVDFAIPVQQMGQRLSEFARSLVQEDLLVADEAGKDEEREWLEARQEICAILRKQVGHDFSGYKVKTFLRRVHRRMQVAQTSDVRAYVDRLLQDQQEVAALFRDLLINVTNFFRDADAFEKLKELVIPQLFENRGADETVRIWVPGCATGEEVFSIAILVREQMDKLSAAPRVQIFATDIDEAGLSIARAGRYPEALLDSVSPERRRRFFVADGDSYVVAKDVRELCIFSPHSIIRDPPFSRIDLVSCRNLLIYFGPKIQSQVVPVFHYALRPGGYLFLGASENVSQFGEMFTPLDRQHRVFRRRDDGVGPTHLPMTLQGVLNTVVNRSDLRGRAGVNTGVSWRQSIETHVLERFGPAYVVATPDGEIVRYSANTGKFLEQSAGAPSRQLLTIARKGLRYDLRVAFREALDTGARVTRGGLAVEGDGGHLQMTTLVVERLADRDDAQGFVLCVFTEETTPSQNEIPPLAASPTQSVMAELEKELAEARERLQALIEEYETALEELKSSNEELVSVNEELQSANEELEASKEEAQSINEELQTVNLELGSKVDALDRANADLHNLFESTQVATVFLDKELTIRSFTPAVIRIFNILPSDRGRPITDLASRLLLPTLSEDVRAVLQTGLPVEHHIEHDGREGHYLVRLLPYRDSSQRNDGVVVTFIDVTTITRAESHQRTLIAELNHRVKNMLTVAISIAEQTLGSTPSPQEFKVAYIDRLRAMARSYELLSRENWTEAFIRELVEQELKPFGDGRVVVEGPPMRIKPSDALSIGMILHELATNAAKYGALSVAGGQVAIAWSIPDGMPRRLRFAWRESGGPPAASPIRQGFGLKLIKREANFNLGGAASVDFDADGLSVTIEFPLM